MRPKEAKVVNRNEPKPGSEAAVTPIYEDQAAQLYWLAFLLTGDRERGVGAAIEALNTDDAANPFFENWMVVWGRKIVIARALGAAGDEMRASVLRTERRRFDCSNEVESAPLSAWNLDSGTADLQLERALLAIDLFPRCVLLLMVFEKLSAEDTVILLNADKDLVMTAKLIGLVELVRNLASLPVSVPALCQAASVDQWELTTI